MYREELCHFGIKGMRWGVRKKREYHADSSKAWKKNRAYELSDAELNRRLNRLNKENQYKTMTASPMTKFGRRVVAGLLVGTAVSVVRTKMTGEMAKAVDKGFSFVSQAIHGPDPENIARMLSNSIKG